MSAADPGFRERPVLVMGLGLFGGGAATARWLVGRGARVTVTDLRGPDELAPALDELRGLDLETVLGEHREDDFRRADLVVANPAVPPSSPYLAIARAAGARVTSEMALFLEHTPARIALVTGTNGKSSTAHALARLLETAGFRAFLGGNIGASLLDEVDGMGREDVAVVEISSYQLEALALEPTAAPRVHVAAITNVGVDHLERHGTPEAYAAAKARVLELLAPGGVGFVPVELAAAPLFSVRDGRFRVLHGPGGELALADSGRFELCGEVLGDAGDVRLAGEFQRENVLVALGAARALGGSAERLAAAVVDLRGLPHRLEDLGTHDGRRVVDNGVSTTPESTLAALASLAPGCTLVCGGQAKDGLGFGSLAAAAGERRSRVVAFGAAAGPLDEAFRAAGCDVRAVDTLDEAVRVAFDRTPQGGTVLFSPACASFDAYSNFRARALAFRDLLP